MCAVSRAIPIGIAVGYLADVLFADPRRGHPVAGFGWCATALEKITYRDARAAGAVHTAVLVGSLAVAGSIAQRRAGDSTALALLTAAALFDLYRRNL